MMVSETMRSYADRDAPQSETGLLIVVSAAHLVSHFYIMVLPVLLPLLKEQLNVGFFELGLALTTFNVVTGLTQAPMGFLVDRVGARPVLIAGLMPRRAVRLRRSGCQDHLSVAARRRRHGRPRQLRLSPGRLRHPGRQHHRGHRIGRAFSVHTFAGFLGGAIAPADPACVWRPSAGSRPRSLFAGLVGPGDGGLVLLLAATSNRGRPLRARAGGRSQGAAAGATSAW